MANNNYPQITSVTSETLQAQIRALLPSQQGFGTDLMAQNVIVPIIDLTAVAQGTNVPEILTTALAFGSQTAFEVTNTTTVIANTAGFWRVNGVSSVESTSSAIESKIQMSDGLSSKDVWQHISPASGSPDSYTSIQIDLVFFLDSGDSLSISTNNTNAIFAGSIRQIANNNGNLVNPSGFSPQ